MALKGEKQTMDQARGFREDRHPSESYEDILDQDTRTPPDFLRQGPVVDYGHAGIPVRNYFDPEVFAKEVEHVWLKVWQWACREEDIPNANDVFVYENVGKSVLLVRQSDGSIKAFYNSCLHRARTLVDRNGHRAELRCMYHGMTWTCAGKFKFNPIEWDFPQFKHRDMSLPELKVDCWGGFVFVNFDAEAAPLIESIGPLAEHFERYDFANRHKLIHVSKVIACNWKVAAEAFMESHHTVATHPQLAAFLGDVNSQYDMLNDYVSRHFTATGVLSPTLEGRGLGDLDILKAMAAVNNPSDDDGPSERMERGTGARDAAEAPDELPKGHNARTYSAETLRNILGAADGVDYSDKSDAEMLDALLYNFFPNQSFWAGYPPNLIYRWRPNGLDPGSSIMDVMILKPVPRGQDRPTPPAEFKLGIDQDWKEAPMLGGLAGVFAQDMNNMPFVQHGLHSSGTGVVHFGLYSEMRIRHMHDKIARMIAEGEERKNDGE